MPPVAKGEQLTDSQQTFLTTGDPNFEYLFGARQGRGVLGPRASGGTSILITGSPGAGKTILACQLCYVSLGRYWAGCDRAIVYTLDESGADLIGLANSFGWLEAAKITQVSFDHSLGGDRSPAQVFVKEVPSDEQTLVDLWRRIDTDIPKLEDQHVDVPQVRIIVIDSINAILRRGTNDLDYQAQFRRLLRDVHKLNAVAIMTLEKHAIHDPQVEEYVPNCVIELSRSVVSPESRTLEIRKARHQKHFIGAHDFTISSDDIDVEISPPPKGVRVYPSLQARSSGMNGSFAKLIESEASAEDIPFGYDPIDDKMGTLKRGSTTLLWGQPGTHKTDLCAKFLARGLPKDDPDPLALFITFKIERAAFLRFLRDEERHAGSNVDLQSRTRIIAARDPFELPTAVLTRIMRTVEDTRCPTGSKVRIERAAVFGLRRLNQLPSYSEQHWEFLEVLVRFLHSYSITTLLIDWPDPNPQGTVPVPMAIDLCSNEIEMVKDETTGKIEALIKRRDYALVGERVQYENNLH